MLIEPAILRRMEGQDPYTPNTMKARKLWMTQMNFFLMMLASISEGSARQLFRAGQRRQSQEFDKLASMREHERNMRVTRGSTQHLVTRPRLDDRKQTAIKTTRLTFSVSSSASPAPKPVSRVWVWVYNSMNACYLFLHFPLTETPTSV